MKKAATIGILASFFFAFTFLLNRSMNLGGGYWMWSASLRYLFTLPLLCLVLILKRGKCLQPVFSEIGSHPGTWLLWSTVGFGLFYLPLTFASVFGESWLVAATWQVTIVAGVLLTPLFGKKIPVKNLLMSCLILIGIFLLQLQGHSGASDVKSNFPALIPIAIAAFSYPLGNRKMMTACPKTLDTFQRVFGMTFCSMPFWLVVSAVAFVKSGIPDGGQVLQSFGVALFSGVIATLLFFYATDLVKTNPKQLAVVEATQSGEVIFTLLGGILVLGDRLPNLIGLFGIALIVTGMILSSLIAGSEN